MSEFNFPDPQNDKDSAGMNNGYPYGTAFRGYPYPAYEPVYWQNAPSSQQQPSGPVYPYMQYSFPEENRPDRNKEKKSPRARVVEFFTADGISGITVSSALCGGALILYFVFSSIFSYLINTSSYLNNLYFSQIYGKTLIDMTYTVFCVGLPFVIAGLVMKKTGALTKPLPFGLPKKGSHTFLLVLSGIAVCFASNVLTNILMFIFSAVGVGVTSYTEAVTQSAPLPANALEFLLMTCQTALFPAVFEEFSFRGIVMQPLRKYGDWYAIIMSSVFFGLIHGNMTQMPFAIIAGIALGYISTVTGSLWSGVILHFCNNFISLCMTLVRSGCSTGTSMLFSILVMYGFFAAGVFAFIGFIRLNPDFRKLYPSQVKGVYTGRKTMVYCLTPPMLMAFIVMLFPLLRDMSF